MASTSAPLFPPHLLLTSLGLLSACFGSAESPAPAPEADVSTVAAQATNQPPSRRSPSGTLVIGVGSDVKVLNPLVYETAADADVLFAIQTPTTNYRFDCGLQSVPALVQDWRFDEAGTTLDLTLRDDITWSDGKPVTAQDMALSYQLAADPTTGSPRIGFSERFAGGRVPEITGAHGLRFTFEAPYDRSTMLVHATLAPLPSHVFAGVAPDALRAHPDSRNPLSNGPYHLAKHEPGQRFVLEPNTAFSGPDAYAPGLERIIFRILPDYTTRLNELMAGQIDLLENVQIRDADRIQASDAPLRIARRGMRRNEYIAWNMTDPRFSDVRVRKALGMAVNVDGLIKELLTGADGTAYAQRAVSNITPALCKAHNDDITPLPYDLLASTRLLAEAGWEDHDGDGIRDKDGQALSFTMITNSSNPRRKAAALLIAATFKKIGVDMGVQTLENNAMYGLLRERDFEAALGGWSAALFIDPTVRWKSDPPDGRTPYNFSGVQDPEVDRLIAEGLSKSDPDEAAAVWRELQAHLYALQPYTWLWWHDELVAVHERFEGTSIDMLSTLHNLHAWTVPPDKRLYDSPSR